MAIDLWGCFPGPVEPILFTVGGSSLAGMLQHLALRRRCIYASRWLALWIGGVVLGLVPTALVFMSLEWLGVAVNWPTGTFLFGFLIGSAGSVVSGKALFVAFSERPEPSDRPTSMGVGATLGR